MDVVSVWPLALLALAAGLGASWYVFARGLSSSGTALLRNLVLYRSLAGFGFVVAVSYPHRTTTDTVDSVLGKFNQNVLVVGVLVLVAFGALALATAATGAARAHQEMQAVLGRVAAVVAGFFAWWFAAVRLHASTAEPVYAGRPALFWPLVWIATTAFFFSSLWWIARYWFGVNEVHPLLGPAVTGLAVVALTVRELRVEGPTATPAPGTSRSPTTSRCG